jgi:opine dehydrogenase
MKIAVLGGGNGSCAAAADLYAGHEIRLWQRNAGAFHPVLEGGGAIRMRDVIGTRDVPVARPAIDIGEAVRGAGLIPAPVPAFAQGHLAALLAPHLADGQTILLPPGIFGSYLMTKVSRAKGCGAEIMVAETGTTRKHGAAGVAIATRATRLPAGVFPVRLTASAIISETPSLSEAQSLADQSRDGTRNLLWEGI